MSVVNDFRLRFGSREYLPIVVGGMGVHFSSPQLALEIARLGGIGHLSDAMVPYVADVRYGTSFTRTKARRGNRCDDPFDKSRVKFLYEEVYEAQRLHVSRTMLAKRGPGAVFINVMEKLTMGYPAETLRARLAGALDGGIDGITLSAGIHQGSFKLICDHPRFRDARLGIIVSSLRALRIFLRSASRVERLPDYIIVEGPLAGGHLGFDENWKTSVLEDIVQEILVFLRENSLQIPVIPAGGIFTGGAASRFLESGAAAVQVATRFTVTKECGISDQTKQIYFNAEPADVVVNGVSPTGYLMRMLKCSPCLHKVVAPCCEALGYLLDQEGKCSYLDLYKHRSVEIGGPPTTPGAKICLCYYFGKSLCYTCGDTVSRLKETSIQNSQGVYQLLSAEHVFRDYQYSSGDSIHLPEREIMGTVPISG